MEVFSWAIFKWTVYILVISDPLFVFLVWFVSCYAITSRRDRSRILSSYSILFLYAFISFRFIPPSFSLYIHIYRKGEREARSSVVVKALCYKPEGREFQMS
jgi:hypothetical protein